MEELDLTWRIETAEDAVQWCENNSVNIRSRPHSNYAKVTISRDTGHRCWEIGEGATLLEAVRKAVEWKPRNQSEE